jgi:hypothetical protein
MRLYKNIIKIAGKPYCVVTINQEDTEDVKVIEQKTPETVHHIHVIDRSGSMTGEISKLIEQVKGTLKLMGSDDIVSVVWFSSEGQYRTLVKGAKNTPELIKLLDTLKSTLGCTCFSDPINEVKTIVEELYFLNKNISVTLFTDGEAVCSRGKTAEEERTKKIVAEFADKVIAFNTVGYSCYYNQNFLKELAALSQFGVFAHSSQIEEYSSIFQNNFERISGGKIERVDVLFPENVVGIYLNRKFVKMETDKISLGRLDKNKNQFFLVSESDFSFDYNGQLYDSKKIKEEAQLPTVTNFLYAYAYGLFYTNHRKSSLDVLAAIADKALIDSHLASFTFDESAEHQKKLETAAIGTSGRLVDGKAKPNYLPAKDAFCVMDLMHLLATNMAYYMPFHKEAESYERIGKKVEESVNYFTYSKDPVTTPFSDFVYNKDKANLSIRNKISGIVKLNPNDADENGLPREVESFIYRNHTFIKDGRVNIKKAIVLMPEYLYETIQGKRKICELINDKKFVSGFSKTSGMEYVLVKVNFNKLPVINALYNESVTAENIFVLSNDLQMLEYKQKCINYYLGKFAENATAAQKKVGIFEGKTAKQMEILEKHGLEKSGAYSGVGKETQAAADCDFYEARSFEFSFKGMKAIPKVEDVINRDKTKKITPVVKLMDEVHAIVLKEAIDMKVDLDKAVVTTRDYLNKQLHDIKSVLFKLRGALCAVKMAKIITGDSFEGFRVDGDTFTYEKDGKVLLMEMSKEKVYF